MVAGEPNAISGIRSKVVSTDVARLQSDGAVQNGLNAAFIAGAPAAMRALIDDLRAAQTKIVLLDDRAAGRCTRCHHGSGFHYQLTKSRFAQCAFQWCQCEALVG